MLFQKSNKTKKTKAEFLPAKFIIEMVITVLLAGLFFYAVIRAMGK